MNDQNVSSSPKKVINTLVLVMLNVSIMASLRNLPLVAEYGLSAIAFFIIVGSFFLLPSALISAELATGWPKEGGIYIWVKEAFGDFWGFFAIWMQWVHNISWYPAILAFVATTIAYVVYPEISTNKYFVLGIVLVVFWSMTALNLLGLKTSSIFSTCGVCLGTIAPGIFLISLGISWYFLGKELSTEISWSALIPDFYKISNFVFLGGMFLAFSGLEVSAGYANEVKNPHKTYPAAIAMSSLITFSLFLLGSLSIAMVLPKEHISLVSGVMEAIWIFLEAFNLTWLIPVMGILLIVGSIAEVNSWIIGPIRALHAATQFGNLPRSFRTTNSKGVPVNLLLFQGVIVTIASCAFIAMPNLSSSYWVLSGLSAQLYLLMYLLMFSSAIKLRYSHPKVNRRYKIPLGNFGIWALGLIGILSSTLAFFLIFLPPSQIEVGSLIFFESFLLVGIISMTSIPMLIHKHDHHK